MLDPSDTRESSVKWSAVSASMNSSSFGLQLPTCTVSYSIGSNVLTVVVAVARFDSLRQDCVIVVPGDTTHVRLDAVAMESTAAAPRCRR